MIKLLERTEYFSRRVENLSSTLKEYRCPFVTIIDSEQTCHCRERSVKEAAVERMRVVQQLSRNQPLCKLTTPSIPEGPPSKATQNSTPFKKCKETQEEAVRANKDRDTSQEAKVLTSNGNEIHREIPNIYFLVESLAISDKCIFFTHFCSFSFPVGSSCRLRRLGSMPFTMAKSCSPCYVN